MALMLCNGGTFSDAVTCHNLEGRKICLKHLSSWAKRF